MERDLFTFDPDDPDHDELAEPARDTNCTPEKLLAFIRRLGRVPTLKECKQEWGGILGPLFDYAELRRRGEV